mgnify:CR=1 FL=1
MALQRSCDVFFYETSRRLGIDKIEETARKLGLGSLTGIELPGEHSGLIPSRAWKQKTSAKYQVTAEPLSCQTDDGQTVVVAKVSGTFPGSPANLTYRFRFSDSGQISALTVE